MNYDTSSMSSCSVHPKAAVVGVCHLCLDERLLIVAAHRHCHGMVSNNSQYHQVNYYRSQSLKQYKIKLPNKIYAFGSSILGHFNSRRASSHADGDDHDDSASPTTDQDSFISIKFEDNGVASWDKGNSVSNLSLDHCNIPWNNHKITKLETTKNNNPQGRTVIKHLETPGDGSMRWRKRIGQMFQLIRWKKSSSKSNGGCHNNVGTSNGANGWIRTLTKRRTKN